MKNWKTTAFGVCTILAAVGAAGKALLDGDPATSLDLTATIAAVMAGFGLIFAKDSNVTGGTVQQ